MTIPWGYADFDNHEDLHMFTDTASGLRAIVAVHSTHLGPAAGGCRLWHYATDEQGLVEALHRYLAQSPALLFNVSLVDAVGERRMQNQPGTGDEYPNWRVPLADSAGNPVLIEQLPDNARANSLVRAVNEALGNRSRLRSVGEPGQPEHTDRTAP